MAEPAPPLAAPVPATPREQFEHAVRTAALYISEDFGGEGTCGWLLSDAQFAAIFAAGDEYAVTLSKSGVDAERMHAATLLAILGGETGG